MLEGSLKRRLSWSYTSRSQGILSTSPSSEHSTRTSALAMGIDHLVGFAGPKDDLQLPDAFGMSLIVDEAVLSCKHMVEVNSPPSE